MTRTKRLLYSFSLDGGLAGTYLLRGPMAHQFEVYWQISIIATELFTGTFTDIRLGWVSAPTALLYVAAGSFPGTVPDFVINNFGVNTSMHFAPIEPFTITIEGGDITDGALEVLLQFDWP